MAFGAVDPDQLDIFAVGEVLAAKGWYLDRQQRPDSLHATVHAGHAATVRRAGRRPWPGRGRGGLGPHREPRHHLRPELAEPAYEVVKPPSTGRAAPVTPLASARHSQAISAAGSSGVEQTLDQLLGGELLD